jgi:hypothetical protein
MVIATSIVIPFEYRGRRGIRPWTSRRKRPLAKTQSDIVERFGVGKPWCASSAKMASELPAASRGPPDEMGGAGSIV